MSRGSRIPGMGRGKRIPGVRAQPIPGLPNRFPGANSARRVHLRSMRGTFIKGGSGIAWDGLEVLIDNTATRGDAVIDTVAETALELVPEMVSWAQFRAAWEDRTGAARAGLRGAVVVDTKGDRVLLYFGHGVLYGFYLETIQGGYFQIVPQTLGWGREELLKRVAQKNALGRNLQR